MIYDHIVKRNGKYYRAGCEVPDNEELPFAEDRDITFDGDVVTETVATTRKGRPKKED